MRHLLLTALTAFLVAGFAQTATAAWFDDFIGKPVHVVHRRAHHPATTNKPAPEVAPMATDTSPPVPLPRLRPDQRAVAGGAAPETTPPVPQESPKSGAPRQTETPATPAGQTPAQSTTPVPPQAQPVTPAIEGESTTPKPPRVYQTACPAIITGLVEAKAQPPIADGGCAEQSPLSVTGLLVNGRMLPLSAPATFNCEMATDLPGWVADVDNYIEATQKTRIKAVVIGGSYECRDRNVDGGSSDLSEHGRADALDFVGFSLEDGRTLTVTNDYNSADATIARLMHFAHDAACTRFTTVLGPDANALHHDHFHLDLGCHGKTCTFRLCE